MWLNQSINYYIKKLGPPILRHIIFDVFFISCQNYCLLDFFLLFMLREDLYFVQVHCLISNKKDFISFKFKCNLKIVSLIFDIISADYDIMLNKYEFAKENGKYVQIYQFNIIIRICTPFMCFDWNHICCWFYFWDKGISNCTYIFFFAHIHTWKNF